MTQFHLDHSRLENVRQRGNDIICACPACREEGKDRDRDNLRIFASGAYNCIAHPKDRAHNRRIFALLGVRVAQEFDLAEQGGRIFAPAQRREWRERRGREFQEEQDKARLRAVAKEHRAKIIKQWEWSSYEVWESSEQLIDCPLVETDSRWFLSSLFPMDSVVWTGDVFETGKDGIHAARWKTVADWQHERRIGPMTTPAIWKPDTISRTGGNVAAAPFVVLDFDGFDGVAPTTQDEIDRHVLDSLALIRWVREGLRWELAAIIWTGSKSLHAWFHSPPPEVLESLRPTAAALGIDASLLGHPEHPCRLPGQPHSKTGELSRVLWLQAPLP